MTIDVAGIDGSLLNELRRLPLATKYILASSTVSQSRCQ